jgi:hypothetical protein
MIASNVLDGRKQAVFDHHLQLQCALFPSFALKFLAIFAIKSQQFSIAN